MEGLSKNVIEATSRLILSLNPYLFIPKKATMGIVALILG